MAGTSLQPGRPAAGPGCPAMTKTNLNPVLAAALAALVDIKKEMLQRRPLLDQTLLVRVADQSVEHLAILLREPVFPGIRTENPLLLLPGVAIPGERHDARVRHAL